MQILKVEESDEIDISSHECATASVSKPKAVPKIGFNNKITGPKDDDVNRESNHANRAAFVNFFAFNGLPSSDRRKTWNNPKRTPPRHLEKSIERTS